MRNFTKKVRVSYLNRKGRKLRTMILNLSDEELKDLTPTPSERVLIEIRNKTRAYDKFRIARN
ncbi:MAG TPA: hypothetical protein DEG09_09480 [Marinilabiliaceae bacterium]|jgi:hypothetical protein|nr:hypothetical protein [Marinilabiliaceae bacterium]HBX88829.1 hypothetical protein [Marinilabiliaceae bacterium]